jgi:hypothetical protein
MATRAPRPPISGSGKRKPNIARLGMVCTTLANHTIGAPMRGRRAARIPIGTPTAIATNVDAQTSSTCSPSSVKNSLAWVRQKCSKVIDGIFRDPGSVVRDPGSDPCSSVFFRGRVYPCSSVVVFIRVLPWSCSSVFFRGRGYPCSSVVVVIRVLPWSWSSVFFRGRVHPCSSVVALSVFFRGRVHPCSSVVAFIRVLPWSCSSVFFRGRVHPCSSVVEDGRRLNQRFEKRPHTRIGRASDGCGLTHDGKYAI